MKTANHINQDRKQRKYISHTFSIALVLFFPIAMADVVLVPGHIEGIVRIDSEIIFWARMHAYNSDDDATQSLYPGVVSAPYDLTVNIPAGTTPTYTVRPEEIRTSDATAPWDYDWLWFPAQSVIANETTPVTADFVLNPANYVRGTVILNGTGELDRLTVHAHPTPDNGYTHRTDQYADNSSRNALDFEFPVSGGDMLCQGTAYLRNGGWITLASQIASPAGGMVTCDWTIDTPQTGEIIGSIEFSGPFAPDRFRVWAGGATNRSWTKDNPANPDNYTLPDLSLGSYSLRGNTYARFDGGDDHFYFPWNAFTPTNTAIEAGDVDIIDIYACQAFAEGTVELIGSADWSDVINGWIYVRGLTIPALPNGGPSSAGRSQDLFDTSNGDFDLILSSGKWIADYAYLNFYDNNPAEYLNEQFYLYDKSVLSTNNPLDLSSCGAVVTRNFEYNMGAVTVNFEVEGAEVLSDPQLRGYCYEYDINNVLLYYYRFDSTNYTQRNLTEGSATFVGPQANCTNVEALATVGGTRTTFGEFDIEVIGGGEATIDIGGPGLTIVEPEVNLCIDGDETTVSGTATDDVGVATVSVNGITALLYPAGGEGTLSTDFSAVIALAPGANSVTTIATDTTGKTGSDTRTVYSDAGPPALSWSPADGATTPLLSIDVTGTVSDDVGIDSVTVNGELVSLTPTGNPIEYSFSVPVSLSLGVNSVTVAVTEETGCAGVVQVRQVTMIENLPPVADAGGTYSVDEGASVALGGSLSSDPDGDPIGFEWDFDYDGVTFDVDDSGDATPTFSAAGLDGPSAVTVAVRVTDDEGESDIATAEVTVNNLAPELGDIAMAGVPVPIGTAVTLGAVFTDAGTPDTHTASWDWGDGSSPGTVSQGAGSGSVEDGHAYATPGVYTVGRTVADADGGSDSATYQYVVVYDPDGSFVTGGGTIDSPAGAYLPDPALTGKANFGFVSKYQKGATVPTGHTEFQFHAAGMDFKSTAYQWLVVAGARAQFKGTGAIKGIAGSFGFMLTAIDGQVNGGDADKFRIKIWNQSDDSVVYDNQSGAADDTDPATVIRSGSIVIHTKGK